jgi:MFS transporter, putative metabolite:H+ symporter
MDRPGISAEPISLSRADLLIVVVCAIGFTFDLSEISFGAALSGVFSTAPYTIPQKQLAWLLSSIYIGAILGPPFMGAFADRYGRRSALAVTLIYLSATSFAAAVSSGIVALSVLRGFSGIALGAYPPLMITYLTDVLPERIRGRWILVTCAIAYLGPPATIFLMRWLTPLSPFGLSGWRWVIGIDAVGALIAGTLFVCLPESATWRKATAHLTERSLHSLRAVWLVIMLSFLAPWATVSFPLLAAAFLVAKGFNLSDTLLYVGISTFGPFAASVLVSIIADRIKRRTSLLICSLGMAGAAVGFYVSDRAGWLMLTSFAFNLSVALYMPALNTYVAELFPVWARARATSWAWSANRVAAAAVPLMMLPLLHSRGEGLVFSIIVGTLLTTILLVVACGPSRAPSVALS